MCREEDQENSISLYLSVSQQSLLYPQEIYPAILTHAFNLFTSNKEYYSTYQNKFIYRMFHMLKNSGKNDFCPLKLIEIDDKNGGIE